MVLYDNPVSTNANKVRFLLAELGVEAELRTVGLGDTPKPADYVQLHPFGLVPTLVDGEVVVTESNVALRYLAEREGRWDLRGEDPARRARVDGLLDSLSLEVRPALWAVEEVVLYAAAVGEDERAARVAALEAKLDAYDRLLDPDGPHALGAGFTIADCALAGRGLHVEKLGLGEEVAPRLRRTLAAAWARPAWARVG